MSALALRLAAPAKVNLSLEVGPLRPDGYHELDTVFAWLDLADEVELAPAPTTSLQVEDRVGRGLPVPAGEDNLVLRALRLLEQEVGRPLPTRLLLRRRIPAGGGLGGASADAAAALLGLDELHGLGLSRDELGALARRLGADVAFGLVGGTARGRGRGDLLTPLPPPPPCTVLLLIPAFALSTAEVYRAWDRLPSPPGQPCCEAVEQALRAQDLEALARALGNHLEAAAEALRPELAGLRRAMLEAGCRAARLCGSGSTLFGLVTGEAEPVARRLRHLGQVEITAFRGQGRP